jgi:hypothetical protein
MDKVESGNPVFKVKVEEFQALSLDLIAHHSPKILEEGVSHVSTKCLNKQRVNIEQVLHLVYAYDDKALEALLQ